MCGIEDDVIVDFGFWIAVSGVPGRSDDDAPAQFPTGIGMRRYTLLLVGLALLTLTGCGQASPAQRTHPEPHPSPTTSSGGASDSRAAETRNPATREPASGQVSTSGSDIQIIQWQGFQISLPGNAVFHEEQPSIFINDFPVKIREK
ncbi:MAG: hypothetical protein RMK84_01785 [Oscillochloridaceae bacterium]|nr:hypothetical protein [Chloroflexaceae bacterium]MDW8388832.1 hypothetical protein [Oscillochloridaceae bacterium]